MVSGPYTRKLGPPGGNEKEIIDMCGSHDGKNLTKARSMRYFAVYDGYFWSTLAGLAGLYKRTAISTTNRTAYAQLLTMRLRPLEPSC